MQCKDEKNKKIIINYKKILFVLLLSYIIYLNFNIYNIVRAILTILTNSLGPIYNFSDHNTLTYELYMNSGVCVRAYVRVVRARALCMALKYNNIGTCATL